MKSRFHSCIFYSFQSATFPQIHGQSISFEDQTTTHRLSLETAPLKSRSFDALEFEAGYSKLNLHSVSSDSGLQTEKTSEMSSGDFNTKMDEEQPSPTAEQKKDSARERKESPSSCDKNKQTPVRLSRVGSVKSRVNIFQHLDPNTAVPSTNKVESKRPTPKKCRRALILFSCEGF